jgi:hypothetical protein
VGSELVRVRRTHGDTFSVAAPPGAPVTVESGRAADAHGNVNADPLRLR